MSKEQELLKAEKEMFKSVKEHGGNLINEFLRLVNVGIDNAKDKNCVSIVLFDNVFANKPLPKACKDALNEHFKVEVMYLELAMNGVNALYPIIVFNSAGGNAVAAIKNAVFMPKITMNFSGLFNS